VKWLYSVKNYFSDLDHQKFKGIPSVGINNWQFSHIFYEKQ